MIEIKTVYLKKCGDCKFAERTVEFDGFCHFYKEFFTDGDLAAVKEKQWTLKPAFCEIEFIQFGMIKKGA